MSLAHVHQVWVVSLPGKVRLRIWRCPITSRHRSLLRLCGDNAPVNLNCFEGGRVRYRAVWAGHVGPNFRAANKIRNRSLVAGQCSDQNLRSPNTFWIFGLPNTGSTICGSKFADPTQRSGPNFRGRAMFGSTNRLGPETSDPNFGRHSKFRKV